MLPALFLVPLLPLAGFAVLALAGGWMSQRLIGTVGVTAGGLSALAAVALAAWFLAVPPVGGAYSQVLWTWIDAGGFTPRIALYLDPLSLVMMLVVCFVGFLILVYSLSFMRGEEGYRRFFAYMNLFLGSMLVLVLAQDLLFLLIGWEGVGLSSYLLIGFWYRDATNGAAARKAFIITRIGDVALLVGLLLIFTQLGSLDLPRSMSLAGQQWPDGSAVATAAALLVLTGALAKSAQLPLHTWLPDAMAGPTPVSALIHAATMVTAGVYLVARMHVLFVLTPAVMTGVAAIGMLTLLYGASCALAQWDIKRVLAYSTISQVGYMFLALGVGAWSAALFHLVTHAFFKALLFLGAGFVIKATGGEHDIRHMGGLRRDMPLVFWTFLGGAASLSALPLVTAGFYSKELIVSLSLTSEQGGAWLYVVAVVTAFLTSLYAFRLVFLVFFGPPDARRAAPRPGFSFSMKLPVIVFAFLAITAGFVQLPQAWNGPTVITDLLGRVLPDVETRPEGTPAAVLSLVIVSFASLAGVQLAFLVFAPALRGRSKLWPRALGLVLSRLGDAARGGWGFDRLYGALFVQPFVRGSHAVRRDPVDSLFLAPARVATGLNGILSRSQRGKLRYYAAVVAFGVLVFVAIGIMK